MIRFRLKQFSGQSKIAEKVIANPYLAPSLSIASLGVAGANLATNKSRHDKDSIYHTQQLRAMDRLTEQMANTAESMNKVNSTMSTYNSNVGKTQQSNTLRKRKSGSLLSFISSGRTS